MTFALPSVRILFWVRCAPRPYCPVKREGQDTERESICLPFPLLPTLTCVTSSSIGPPARPRPYSSLRRPAPTATVCSLCQSAEIRLTILKAHQRRLGDSGSYILHIIIIFILILKVVEAKA